MSHDGSSWMRMNRATPEWINGLKKFIETTFRGTYKSSTAQCPCSRCRCMAYRVESEVVRHLLRKGFDESFIQEQESKGEALPDDDNKDEGNEGHFTSMTVDQQVQPQTPCAEEKDGTDDASHPGLKEKLGYSVRDFLYYKKRCGSTVATLEPIDSIRDVDRMIEDNQEERKIRLVLSTEQLIDNQVTITPMKRKRGQPNSDDLITNEQLDAYKGWLANLQTEEEHTEFMDDYRDATIKTYKEWLRRKGHLDYILSFLKADHTNNNPASLQDEESQDGSPTPPEWPSHAQKNKQQENGGGSQGVRGCLKRLATANKRVKNASQKLSIQFSARLGGPAGENSQTFVDEVVIFTRKRAPLIGVKKWEDVKQNVKITIAEDLLSRWDFPNIDNAMEKIWDIAKEQYEGWRSTFISTYNAYNTYAEQMKHKPEDIDIVEWHYLMMCFGTEKSKNDPASILTTKRDDRPPIRNTPASNLQKPLLKRHC